MKIRSVFPALFTAQFFSWEIDFKKFKKYDKFDNILIFFKELKNII